MLRDSPNSSVQLDSYLGVFRYGRRAIELVWSTDQRLTVALAVLTLTAGVLPAGIAYVGKLIVDSVVAAIAVSSAGGAPDYAGVMWFVAIEGLLVAGMAATQRGIGYCQTLLRVLLSQSVNTLILEKALTLELAQFEDSEFYDKLNRARQEASSRPLSLVTRTFNLLQHGISLASYATLLLQFSGWAVLVLIAAGLPAFIAETYFSGERFRMFRHRSAERRKLLYLEMVLAREDHAKEIKLFQLGTELLRRYKKIFQALFEDERRLTRRQDGWGLVLGLISNAAFYGAYAWIAVATIQGTISLGQMTMYLVVFKQGQSSVSAMLGAIGGLYEDNLYLSNLYEYLEQPTLAWAGASAHGPEPSAGVVFEHVSFTYPGASRPAVRDLSLTLTPGQSVGVVGRNGSGKTTLIKLLAGLYPVDEGRILYEGRNLEDWDAELLRKRIGIIFQDFNRYQLEVGENIGVGDEPRLHDAAGWAEAAQLGQAANFIEKLPEGYHTQLGRWFHQGQELSGGEWQRIALSRAFMRQGAEILVLDEPTAAMDAETEADIFEHFQSLTQAKIVVLISHRFSTVRQADLIVVMDQGQIIERGSHEELVALGGQYARLFELQARGYR
ncbi:MAG: ABC transporter ATP-binding protein/permease [Gammaproteobacteria bacterium]|nr:ABC transporter ATP-binding protein/permease [Gammaproteobacteria bacterium]